MPPFALFALSLALAMDAFAVALTTGMRLSQVTPGHLLRMAGVFGFFQFAMPVVGWYLGFGVQPYIENWDHWVAFGLLLFISARMFKEAWDNRGKAAEECEFTDNTKGRSVLLLGLAVSIDALAVGLSLALLGIEVWAPAIVIGVVCFVLTAMGLMLGRLVCLLGRRFANLGNWANVLGAVVLLGIGFRILSEHGVFT